jgi:MSHA biogenesis protein MshO
MTSTSCGCVLRARRYSSGLTLMELILSLTIVGILVGMTALFMRLPMESNATSRLRLDLVDSAELALRHMDQELRAALPNSVRVSAAGGTYLEFLATRASGRYRTSPSVPVGACPAGAQSGTMLVTEPGSDTCFSTIGPVIASSTIVPGSDYIVIRNDATHNAYSTGAADGPNKALIAAGGYTASLAGTAPSESRFRFTGLSLPASDNNLFYVVSGPVTYMCDVTNGQLLRYAGYPIATTQPMPPLSGTVSVIVTGLSSCAFDYGLAGKAAGLLDQGIVSVKLTLSRTAPGTGGSEAISLIAQIPVDRSQ